MQLTNGIPLNEYLICVENMCERIIFATEMNYSREQGEHQEANELPKR